MLAGFSALAIRIAFFHRSFYSFGNRSQVSGTSATLITMHGEHDQVQASLQVYNFKLSL